MARQALSSSSEQLVPESQILCAAHHPEYLNTPRLVADDTQQTVWKWEQQEPFGAGACNPDPDGDNVQFEFNLRFPGQYFDRETNLHYNYFRDYDADTGRYVQSDLLGLRAGLNTFAYVSGMPLLRRDFAGLMGGGGNHAPTALTRLSRKVMQCMCAINPFYCIDPRDISGGVAGPHDFFGVPTGGVTILGSITISSKRYGKVASQSGSPYPMPSGDDAYQANIVELMITVAHEIYHKQMDPLIHLENPEAEISAQRFVDPNKKKILECINNNCNSN